MIKSTYLNNYWIYKERQAQTAVPLLWQITIICVLHDNESSSTPVLTALHKMISRYHRDIVMVYLKSAAGALKVATLTEGQ